MLIYIKYVFMFKTLYKNILSHFYLCIHFYIYPISFKILILPSDIIYVIEYWYSELSVKYKIYWRERSILLLGRLQLYKHLHHNGDYNSDPTFVYASQVILSIGRIVNAGGNFSVKNSLLIT